MDYHQNARLMIHKREQLVLTVIEQGLTLANRSMPDASPETALTTTKLYLLDRLAPDRSGPVPPSSTLALYLTKLARPRRYLARAKDPPPGNLAMGR